MEANANRPSVLLVEHNPELRAALRLFFVAEGCRVIEATDGKQALQRLYAQPQYDLILMEIQLPKEHGLDVLQKAKMLLGGLPPVLVVSTCTQESVIERSFDLGVIDFLGKPFSVRTLRRRVQEVIQGHEVVS